MGKKEEIINSAESLIEMYKAGFLDGYKIKKNIRSKASFDILNKFYLKSFEKRFGNKITKELNKKK